MDATFASFVGELAKRREAVREAHPRPDESSLRRTDAIQAADGFEAEVHFTYPQWFDARR
jgi:hypothetical protein